jgi:hypothetical protein
LATGAYSVKVKDNVSGCVSTATATTINAQPASVTIINVTRADPSVLSCPALNNGTITVTASGANLQYSIDNGVTYQTSNLFTGLLAGSYAVKVKDNATGCDVVYPSNPVILGTVTCPSCPTPSVGGTTAFTGGTVCNTANSGVITLTGKTGNVVKWQTSTNGGTSWTDIANTTTTLNFTFTNAVNNQQYRAVVNNSGACVDANSTATAISTSTAACSAACDVPKPVVTGH